MEATSRRWCVLRDAAQCVSMVGVSWWVYHDGWVYRGEEVLRRLEELLQPRATLVIDLPQELARLHLHAPCRHATCRLPCTPHAQHMPHA